MDGLLDGIALTRFAEGPVLFVHTGGTPALFAYHPAAAEFARKAVCHFSVITAWVGRTSSVSACLTFNAATDQGRADQVFPPLAANTGVGPFLTAAGLRQAQGGPRTNGGRMEMDMHSRNATKAPPWKLSVAISWIGYR